MSLLSTLNKLIALLEEKQINYMLFGGVANAIYGENRLTLDIDVKLHLQSSTEKFIALLLDNGIETRVQNPLSFIAETQVLPCVWEGVCIDFIFANLPYEREALDRAVRKDIGGMLCRICTAEDLIIQKFVSQREKDWLDIQGVIKYQKSKLDIQYILIHAEELARWMSTSKKYDELKKILHEK